MRLDTIEANTNDRLSEARGEQLLGEVVALETDMQRMSQP